MTEAPAAAITSSAAERAVRRILLATMVIGSVGIGCDLLLLEHTEDPLQLLPLAALALLLVLLILHGIQRKPVIVRLVQWLMLGLFLCGALGVWLHFDGNAEFQIELNPDISRGELIWKALRAKAPPALAPLALVQLGLVGLAWSWRHPLLGAAPSG